MNYAKIVFEKEKIHWKRMQKMLQQFKGFTKIIGIIGLIVLSIIHYAYLGMHSAYEGALFMTNRPMFYSNLIKLQESLAK